MVMSNFQELLRPLIDTRDRQIQKSRIAFANRVQAIEDGRDEASSVVLSVLKKYEERFADLEEELNQDIKLMVKDIPIVQELVNVKGISWILAGRLVGLIDIHRANSQSALWRYCGLGVLPWCNACEKFLEGGTKVCPHCGSTDIIKKAERLIQGETAHFSVRLKTTCYNIGSSFLKCNSPYRLIYDRARTHYDEARPEWNDLRKHYSALRKMVKMFLSHLWERWRLLEGLPIRTPYAIAWLDHKDYISPEEFGWPKLESKKIKGQGEGGSD
jgi:hypothetical protein